MELRNFAERVLLADDLTTKLIVVREQLTDLVPGPALRLDRPTRPPQLQFAPRRSAPPLPHPQTWTDPRRRGIVHHVLANHELQALEVMAWVLLAFPDAPSECRAGIARIMADEQQHTRMHVHRAAALGVTFGEFPVNNYIWEKAQSYENLIDYFAGLPLTFEARNLDHSSELEQHFRAVGDLRSATVLKRIHLDEIEHVAFGWTWLNRLKPPELSAWEAYNLHLHWPMRPEKSVGKAFLREPRLQAGLSEEFVNQLDPGLQAESS